MGNSKVLSFQLLFRKTVPFVAEIRQNYPICIKSSLKTVVLAAGHIGQGNRQQT